MLTDDHLEAAIGSLRTLRIEPCGGQRHESMTRFLTPIFRCSLGVTLVVLVSCGGDRDPEELALPP